MNILEENKNFKLKQNLEKLLLLSILSTLPNSNSMDTYSTQINPPYNTNNYSDKSNLNQTPNLQQNNYNVATFQKLKYELTPTEIEFEKIKKNILYTI